MILKILLIVALLCVLYQDVKDKKVDYALFIIIPAISGYLFFQSVIIEMFFINVVMNISLIICVLIVLNVCCRLILKRNLTEAFGLGDAILFLGFGLTFSFVSFIIIFVFSLFFSIALHTFLNIKRKEKLLPLAGYMCLFYSLVYLSFWSGLVNHLYSI